MTTYDNTHQTFEEKLNDHAQHRENVPVMHSAFNRRHSLAGSAEEAPQRRRSSIAAMKASFDATNIAMTFPVGHHLEMTDDANKANSIDDIGAGWFVWLVAFTASIAGALFGYDTGESYNNISERHMRLLIKYKVSSPPSSST